MERLRGEHLTALSKCVLFETMDVKELQETLQNRFEIQEFINNDSVYTRTKFNDSVGIVLVGNVEVYKDEGRTVMLNRIMPGGFFGAAALFAEKKEYVSVLVAKGECAILFITFEDFKGMLVNNSTFSLNYIKFLSGRIEFLNRKIDEFTASDTSEKLVLYLTDNATRQSGKFVCRINSMVELSKNLDMGRASLYRSLDELESKGLIIRDGRNIVIDDIDKLKKRGN